MSDRNAAIAAQYQELRDAGAKRRARNRAAGLCINENARGTHGPATHGVLCAACREVHRGSHKRSP